MPKQDTREKEHQSPLSPPTMRSLATVMMLFCIAVLLPKMTRSEYKWNGKDWIWIEGSASNLDEEGSGALSPTEVEMEGSTLNFNDDEEQEKARRTVAHSDSLAVQVQDAPRK